jgi:hypothetical protein
MDPLTEPSIIHPQSPFARTVPGPGEVPASGMDLGGHREQRSGHRTEHTRRGHPGTQSLPRTARCRAQPDAAHVDCCTSGAASSVPCTVAVGQLPLAAAAA